MNERRLSLPDDYRTTTTITRSSPSSAACSDELKTRTRRATDGRLPLAIVPISMPESRPAGTHVEKHSGTTFLSAAINLPVTMKFNSIKGKIVDVKGVERESCCDLSVQTKEHGVVKMHLSSGRMGLGHVDPDGYTGTIVKQLDKSTGAWLPTSFSNPKRLIGMHVDIDGSVNDDSRGIRVDKVRSFKLT